MATFSPPTDNFVSPVIAGEFMNGQYLAATERLANQWGKHVALSPRGRNVFLLTDTEPSPRTSHRMRQQSLKYIMVDTQQKSQQKK
jgi:hypothetical protein